MADDSVYTYPDGPQGASFSKADWARSARAVKLLDARRRATCKHLIKSGKPITVKRVNYETAQEEREKWEEKMRAAEREAGGYE